MQSCRLRPLQSTELQTVCKGARCPHAREDLVNAALQPDTVCYSSVLNACAQAGASQLAESWLLKMGSATWLWLLQPSWCSELSAELKRKATLLNLIFVLFIFSFLSGGGVRGTQKVGWGRGGGWRGG